MKKIVLISAFLLVTLSCFSQEITPIQISRTYHFPGVSDWDLYLAYEDWGLTRSKESDYTCPRWYSENRRQPYIPMFSEDLIINDKNFGVSKFLGGDNTCIHLIINISSKWGICDVSVSKIKVYSNPDLGVLLGEDNVPSPLVYNKKQLKLAKEILFYVYQVADEIFLDIENWMREKCPTPDSGVERIL